MNANKHIIENIIWAKTYDTKDVFENIYKKNLWQSEESVSGIGSEEKSTKSLVKHLPEIFKKLNVRTILDAPCGDFLWMNKVDYKFNRYIGIDIVQDLIIKNKNNYSNDINTFLCLNIICDTLPKTDLILCRDCFIHLSFKDIFATIENFKKSNAKYLLTTTYKNLNKNIDIYTGNFRKINLIKAPFLFPIPELEIHEENDKYLSLWRISDL